MSAIDVLRDRIYDAKKAGSEVTLPLSVAVLLSAEYASMEFMVKMLEAKDSTLPGLMEMRA